MLFLLLHVITLPSAAVVYRKQHRLQPHWQHTSSLCLRHGRVFMRRTLGIRWCLGAGVQLV